MRDSRVPSVGTTRLGHLHDPGGGVEGALLEQQAALAEQLPVLLGEHAHEPVAVHRLDHEPAFGPQHAAELRERADVLLVAEVAERAEQVHHEVEARVAHRQVAIVGMDPLRPALALRAPPRIAQQGLRAVGAGHAIAGAGERDRVAPEPARRIEHVAAVRRPRELRRGERLRLGLRVGLVMGERTQVELAEELVPPLRGADARALHAMRVYGGRERRDLARAAGEEIPHHASLPALTLRREPG